MVYVREFFTNGKPVFHFMFGIDANCITIETGLISSNYTILGKDISLYIIS